MKKSSILMLLALRSTLMLAQNTISFDNGFENSIPVNGAINTFAHLPNGQIIIGGTFSSYNGTARNGIARLNADGSLDNTWAPAGINTATDSILVIRVQTDGKILVGGRFNSFNGTTRNHYVRLNEDGTVDTGFANIRIAGTISGSTPHVRDIAIQSDGKVVLVGDWTGITSGGSGDACTCRRIIRVNGNDGTRDATFSGVVQGSATRLNTVIVHNDNIYISGYGSYNGSTVGLRLQKLNSDGSLDETFSTGVNNAAYDLAIDSNGKLLVAGLMTGLSGGNFIGRFNLDGSLDNTFSTMANGPVHSIDILPNGRIAIGGSFTEINNTPVPKFALLEDNGDLSTNFLLDPSVNISNTVRKIALTPTFDLMLAGNLSNGCGCSLNHIVRLSNAFEWQFERYSASYASQSSAFEISNTQEFGLDDFSIELWFKAPSSLASGAYQLFSKQNVSINELELNLVSNEAGAIHGIELTSTIYTPHSFVLTNPIEENTWNHIVLTISETGYQRYYLNGFLVGELNGTINSGTDADFPFVINLDGSLAAFDELRIWNIELTQISIRLWMNLELTASTLSRHPSLSNLITYIPFNSTQIVDYANYFNSRYTNNNFPTSTLSTSSLQQEASTAPIGSRGISSIQEITSTGHYIFENTDLALTFNSTIPNDELVVTKIDHIYAGDVPDALTIPNITTYAINSYWIIRNYGINANLDADIELWNIENLSNADTELFLAKRESTSFSSWYKASESPAHSIDEDLGYAYFPNIASFSQFIPISESGMSPLPVVLVNFDGNLSETLQEIHINWSTAFELDNEKFILYKLNPSNNQWNEIYSASGINGSLGISYYTYSDHVLEVGDNRYKLHQKDINGTEKQISNVLSIKNDLAANQIILYPNPFSDYLTVIISFEEAQLEIIDLLKNTIAFQSTLVKGKNQIITSHLPKGLYLVKIQSGDYISFNKLIKI